jgi:thioesterase domain-containing protein
MPDGNAGGPIGPSWMVPLRAAGTRPPLFCACAGDGDVTKYRDLAQALADDQPVYGFGIPPLPAGAAFPSVEQLASDYVQAARAVQPEGPYFLCGHSFGGLVAYEMAALLQRAGAQVRLVALIDTLHPGHRRQMSWRGRMLFRLTYLASRLMKYARNIGYGRPDQALRDAARAIYSHTKRGYWRIVRTLFARLGHAPPAAISSDALVLAAAWHAYGTTSHDVPLVMFNAIERPVEFHRDRTLGWRSCVSRPFSLHMIPGDHYTILRRPHVQVLADTLASYLTNPAQPARMPENIAWR